MIELTEAVRELRSQLNSALSDAGPGPVRFELGPVEIEAVVTVDRSSGAGGKINFWMVEATADASVATSSTHRITLTLQPVLVTPGGEHRTVLISGEELELER